MSASSLFGVILVCALWGFGFPFMKIGLRYIPPFLFVGSRFVITSVCILLYMRLLHIEWRLARRMWGWILALTALFSLQQCFIFVGLTYTSAGRMGVIVNTQPIITAVAAHWLVKHDRLTWGKVAGLLMAISGVFFVFRESFTHSSRAILFGDMLGLIASLSWSAQTIMTKHVGKYVTASAITFWESVISCVPFLVLSGLVDPTPLLKRPLDLTFFAVFAYIILVATVFGFIAWVYLLRHNNPSRVASFCFITPIASVFFSWLLLGEPLTCDMLVATVLVGLGIFVANFQLSRPAPAAKVEGSA